MKNHRSIQHTVTPDGYVRPEHPKKKAQAFNKWAAYIHKEVRKITKAA